MIEWIVSSCVLILVIVLLRRLFMGRISSRLRYALWLCCCGCLFRSAPCQAI